MLVYRITKSKYAEDLSGNGAKKFGGRWNNRGVPVVYTSAHISLAFLELLVNADVAQLQETYKIIEIELDEKALIDHIKNKDLPFGWRAGHQTEGLQDLGTTWLRRNSSLVLEVPSAVIPYESNYLINPLHPDFHLAEINEIKDLDIDRRFLWEKII